VCVCVRVCACVYDERKALIQLDRSLTGIPVYERNYLLIYLQGIGLLDLLRVLESCPLSKSQNKCRLCNSGAFSKIFCTKIIAELYLTVAGSLSTRKKNILIIFIHRK